MYPKEVFQYAGKEILKRKKRSSGIIVNYFLCTIIIVAVASLTHMTRDSSQKILLDIGAHTMAYIPRLTIENCCVQAYETPTYDPGREGFYVNNAPSNMIRPEQIEAIQRSALVADASPYLLFRIRASEGLGEWLIGGLDLTRPVAHSATVVAKSQVLEGEFLQINDPLKIMVEKEFAAIYNLEPGQNLQIGHKTFVVAAIVNPPLRPGKANIYMSLTCLRQLLSERLEIDIDDPANAVLIESKGAQYHDAAKAEVSRILGLASRISSYGCYKAGTNVLGLQKKSTWMLSSLVIFCMLLIAMKIQFTSVVQRTNDIGVLKAIGWPESLIVSQIMMESFIYSFSGSLTGILISGILLKIFSPGLFESLQPVSFSLLLGLIVPVCGGFTAGFLASRKAARLKTAEILRSI